MKKIYLVLIIAFAVYTNQTRSQYLVSAMQIYSASAPEVEGTLQAVGWTTTDMVINGVNIYSIAYNTVDAFGEATVASGAFYVPAISDTAMPLVAYHHGTVFDRYTVPSMGAAVWEGYIFAGNGFLVTSADYLGKGANEGMHPFFHAQSEATASIDLIRACREFMADSLSFYDNGEIFLSGYSQGGHAAMSSTKYIQENDLTEEFKVLGSAPLSGVYSLSDAQMNFVYNDCMTFATSHLMPYIFASYQYIYGDLYDSYSDYYNEPYDSLVEMLVDGDYTSAEWNKWTPAYAYDYLQDEVLDAQLTDENDPYNVAMRANDLHNWVPEVPIKMVYCNSDDIVAPENSVMAEDTMTDLGATDVEAIMIWEDGTHMTCFIPTMAYAVNWFLTLRTPYITDIENIKKQEPELHIYPSPANDILNIEYLNNLNISILSIDGKLILSTKTNSIDQIDISRLSSGAYILRAVDTYNNNNVIHKKFTKR